MLEGGENENYKKRCNVCPFSGTYSPCSNFCAKRFSEINILEPLFDANWDFHDINLFVLTGSRHMMMVRNIINIQLNVTNLVYPEYLPEKNMLGWVFDGDQ